MTELANDKWHFKRGGAVQPPLGWYEFHQLVWTGGLKRSDEVWNKASAKWVPAAEHPDVRRVLIERKAAQGSAIVPPASPKPTPSTPVRPTPIATPTPPIRSAVFAVQVTDPSSGQTSAVEVVAATADDARAQVASTGMTVSAVVLKSFGSPSPDSKPQQLPPPSFGAPPAPQAGSRDGTCPSCGTTVLSKGLGFHDAHERAACALICLPLCGLGVAIGFLLNFSVEMVFCGMPFIGIILALPVCITYYFFTSARDYCPSCKKRVGDRRFESVIGWNP